MQVSSNEKQEKYHTVGTISKSNIKIVERGKIDITNTQIHDRSLSCLGTGTSINMAGLRYLLGQSFQEM
jgi:hypothetical protein